MYKYETHLHTYPVSRCAKASVEETVAFYKAEGYDGIFITNHFIDANINYDKTAPHEEKIEFFFSDYEKAVQIGKELGIKVFCGVEMSYKGTHFLVYGLDKQWFLEHPEIMDMEKSQELAFLMESGALVIQAHPFQEASYIDHIRLYPRHVHGVEVINASRKEENNQMAELYCDHYGLIEFAGSDNHKAGNAQRLAGISCEEPIESVPDFIEKVLSRQFEIFVETRQ